MYFVSHCVGLFAHRHDALLAAFAGRRQVPRFEVEVAGAQVNQLGHAQAGGVEHFDEGAIPETARGRDIGLCHEPLDLFDAKKLRKRRPRAWCLKIVGGVGFEMLREYREAVEASHRRDRARDRARRQPLIHQPVDETLEIAAVHDLKRFLERRGKFSKALEIAAITLERMIGESSLDAQVREIRIDEIVGG